VEALSWSVPCTITVHFTAMITVLQNTNTKVEPTDQCGRMATTSGQNVLEAENITSSISREPTEKSRGYCQREQVILLSVCPPGHCPWLRLGISSTLCALLFHDLLLRSYLYHCVWSVITAHSLTPEQRDNNSPPPSNPHFMPMKQHSTYNWHLALSWCL